MKRFIAAMSVILGTQVAFLNPLSAESLSPLDRPVEDIKKDIATIAACTWRENYPLSHACTDREELTWLHLELTPGGKIDHLWFLPTVAAVVGVNRPANEAIYGETGSTRREQATVLAIVKKIWPSWTASDQWLKHAFKKAWTRYAQDSVRVGDTSVYVSESMYADRDEHYGLLVFTKKTDLTEFKLYRCEDDEQGPGLDNCTDRNGEPKPPDNPILHPK